MTTRAIQTELMDGVWWLVDGDGERFVSVGVNHLQPNCWLAPYNLACMRKRYGADLAAADGAFNAEGEALPRLVNALKVRLADLGFNTLGIHTTGVPSRLFAEDLYYCVVVTPNDLGSRFRFGSDTFPDIFSDAFAGDLDARVRKICLEHRSNRRLIGYAFSDIPRWYFYEGQELDRRAVHPWVEDLLRLPDDAPGKRACVACLGKASASTREESDAVMAMVVTRWYELHAQAIRRYDTSHMLLGDKLHSPHRLPAWLVPIVARHADILFIQWYTQIDQQRETLIDLHEQTGKPILNGDSSFSWRNPEKQTRVKGVPLDSREAVGRAYTDYLRGVMGLPFMLGWHHCGIVEQWDGASTGGWQANETGFLDPFETPYPEITGPIREANRRAAEWHAASR